MSNRDKFVRNFGQMRLAGYGVEIYTTESGGAVLVCDKHGHTLTNKRMEFKSLELLEEYLDQLQGNTAGKLDTLLSRLGVGAFGGDDQDD